MNELSPGDSMLIDKYLRNQFSEADHLRFSERIEDPQFKKEFDFRSSLVEVSLQKGDEKLYSLLEKESERLDRQKPKRSYGAYWIILALLSIAGLYYFLAIHQSQPSNEELFLAHYEVFPNLISPTERSSGANLNGAELALYSYDRGDFKKASAIFDTLSTMNSDLIMYHAISNLENGELERAEQLLLTLSENDQARYREAADWYLCLLFLKQGDEERLSMFIDEIKLKKNHKYLSKLEQLR